MRIMVSTVWCHLVHCWYRAGWHFSVDLLWVVEIKSWLPRKLWLRVSLCFEKFGMRSVTFLCTQRTKIISGPLPKVKCLIFCCLLDQCAWKISDAWAIIQVIGQSCCCWAIIGKQETDVTGWKTTVDRNSEPPFTFWHFPEAFSSTGVTGPGSWHHHPRKKRPSDWTWDGLHTPHHFIHGAKVICSCFFSG